MKSKLRKDDEKCANIVAQFLKEQFYDKYTTNYRYVNEKDLQVQGIDTIFTLNDHEYHCDEKAAIRYCNRPLKTFSLELSFINRKGDIQDGWLLEEKKTNDSFLFVWLDKGKKDMIDSIDDIQELEYALVKKEKILEHLKTLGWTKERLVEKQERIRYNSDESLGNLYKHGCKFSTSPHLVEQPINILLPRQAYLDIADKHEKIMK